MVPPTSPAHPPEDAAPVPDPQADADMRIVDTTSLQALAHPLRVRIWEMLSAYGPATASRLGKRLGESSGATSYHLRILARHGFVVEQPQLGTARERWWNAVSGKTSIRATDLAGSPAGREAVGIYLSEASQTAADRVRDFEMRAIDTEPREWTEAATVMIGSTAMTAQELAKFSAEMASVVDRWFDRFRGRLDDPPPGTRPVHVQLYAFPLPDPDADLDGAADSDGPSDEVESPRTERSR